MSNGKWKLIMKDSEKKQESNLEREIIAGEWMGLCKHKVYRMRSRQGRILAVYQAISNRLDQLIKVFYEIAKEQKNLDSAKELMDEITYLRKVRDDLLQSITWNKNNIPSQIPEEVEAVIG
ncbi:hypothetical protein KKB06_03510 [Patescibacteria group bacterium]|nr:hypothetical protein [Patescibacteria group bacterium]